MAKLSLIGVALSSVLVLGVAGCSTPAEESIENTVVIEGEEQSSGSNGSTGTDTESGESGNNNSGDNTNSGGTPSAEPTKEIKTVEDIGFSNPNPSGDPKAELDKLASQSINALLAFGIYESFEDPNTNVRISYAFDPKASGNQLGIKTENLETGEVSYNTGNRISWLTPHLIVTITTDPDSTVVIKSDHIEADIGGKGIYKYYFENGVIVRLEGKITGMEPFTGTLEYVTDKRVTDLIAAVN